MSVCLVSNLILAPTFTDVFSRKGRLRGGVEANPKRSHHPESGPADAPPVHRTAPHARATVTPELSKTAVETLSPPPIANEGMESHAG